MSNDYLTAAEVEAIFGVSVSQLRRADYSGLIREGTHFRRTASGRRQYVKSAMKTVIPEIRALTRRLRGIKKTRAERIIPPARKIAADSSRKRTLLEAIAAASQTEQLLYDQLAEVQRCQAELHREYWSLRWETPDCPYCRGSQLRPDGASCSFCWIEPDLPPAKPESRLVVREAA